MYKRQETHNSRIAFLSDCIPLAQYLFYCSVRHNIVGINTRIKLRTNVGISRIVSSMHTAVFFIDILNLESVIAVLPITHQFCSIVRRAVVYNQPDKVLAALTAEAVISARKRMGTIKMCIRDRSRTVAADFKARAPRILYRKNIKRRRRHIQSCAAAHRRIDDTKLP